MKLEIIPSIDLRNGKVVRLQQGDYTRQIDYAVDPLETARSFADDGARWMHIVDLDGAKEGRPVQERLVGEIARASGLRVEAGGGVRTADDIRRLLAAGAERVVIGTKAIEDWDWFESVIAEKEFDRRLVLALDARDGIVATRGWTHASQQRAVDVARDVSAMPLAALLYTDVSHDGMLDGPNVAATVALATAGAVPVIASGGVGRIEDVQSLVGQEIWGVVIGRSLYEGRVNLREAIRIGDSK